MISTTSHVALQTLGILCASLYCEIKHYFILIWSCNELKSLLNSYYSLGELGLAPSHPIHSCRTMIDKLEVHKYLQNSKRCCIFQKYFQRLFHISLEIYFRQLKWVLCGFSFFFMVCEKHLFQEAYVCTRCGLAYKFKKKCHRLHNTSQRLYHISLERYFY